jgi:hypothetical protein
MDPKKVSQLVAILKKGLVGLVSFDFFKRFRDLSRFGFRRTFGLGFRGGFLVGL